MYNTPRKSASGRYGTPQKVPLKKGLFLDGIWHCNCDPRLPASHFQVKKDGPNRGRWFYTCQESKESGCGFFLWDTDAAPREIKSVINNTRSETDASFKTPADAARDEHANKNTVEGHIAASNQWIKQFGGQDEEEFGDWPLTAEDEKELVVMDTPSKTSTLHGAYPETPRKVVKVNSTMTPGSKRKFQDDSLPTPQTEAGAERTPARLKGGMWDGNERPGLLSPLTTPTPARFYDATLLRNQSVDTDSDLTNEVMDILRSQNIDDETTTKLRDILNKHALKSSGIAKGRDISRMALKTKDAKIIELQHKISALETEREMDKVVIRNIKGDIARSIVNKKGRGRGRGVES